MCNYAESYQEGDKEVKDVPATLPEDSEVVDPFQGNFNWEENQREAIQEVQQQLNGYYGSRHVVWEFSTDCHGDGIKEDEDHEELLKPVVCGTCSLSETTIIQ